MALTSAQVRQQFIDFFVEAHGHAFVPSSPVVPHDDPTLLFANAGMNQFKPLFLGQADPNTDLGRLKSAVNSQKCIRAGGKHNDLEDVGADLYHHTFFEMLGNWSFGDYFKEEAIDWAWDLLVNVWGLDPERLYATYFEGDRSLGLDPDREAYDLWLRHLPAQRVLPGDSKDNFWEMGDTGPCGPCSELHYDGRPDHERMAEPGYNLVNRDNPDVIEIWNLVFIQFDRVDATTLRPLPAKHVDTGMGLERITRVLQGRTSNYDTDLFTPIFDEVRRLTGAKPYTGSLTDHRDIAYRVIADHARALTFALTDGAAPSNEGRGYVLRRILRRAFRHGWQTLGMRRPFLHELVTPIAGLMGGAFPELKRDPGKVARVIHDEEEGFARTIERGIAHFERAAHGVRTVSAQDAFQLHDTFGFPIDLTQIMAQERGVEVDVAGYESLMEEARLRSRVASRGAGAADALELSGEEIARLRNLNIKPTDDADKFHSRPIRARIRAIWNGTDFDEDLRAGATRVGERHGIVLDRTNFYAEMGGQAGDAGRIAKMGGDFEVESTRAFGGYVLHCGRLRAGTLRVGDEVQLEVDDRRRRPIMANHTATHLLNLALRDALGDGVEQKGSLVAHDRLRFDFSAAAPLTPEQLERVESSVRERIAADLQVFTGLAPLARARTITGVRAVFGETYPDPVRVVSVGVSVPELLERPENPDWMRHSVEFCGGTHLQQTAAAKAFAILSEEGVAKGVRRINALTGPAALAAIEAGERLLDRASGAQNLPDEQLPERCAEMLREMEALTIPATIRRRVLDRIDGLQDRVKGAQKKAAAGARERAVDAARALAPDPDAGVVVERVPAGGDRQALLAALDAVRARHEGCAAMLLSVDEDEGKVVVVASVPKSQIEKGLKAGDWVRIASEAVGGKGGGRPDSAQGGGSDPSKAAAALKAALAHARAILA